MKALGNQPVEPVGNKCDKSGNKIGDVSTSSVYSSLNATDEGMFEHFSDSSQFSEQPSTSVYSQDSGFRGDDDQFTSSDCDESATRQKVTDELHLMTVSRTKGRKRGAEMQQGEFLPASYVLGRQVSRERKRMRRSDVDEQCEVQSDKKQNTEEIDDAEIEQYIRTDEEINFIKRLEARK